MQEVLSVFDNAFHAVLAPSPSGLVINTDEKVKNPIQAGNASMGVKAFAIIRFLIENGSFQMMTYSFWMNRKSTCILNGSHVRARIGAYGQNTECENAHYYAQPVLLASLGGLCVHSRLFGSDVGLHC